MQGGDILLVRTGWLDWYLDNDDDRAASEAFLTQPGIGFDAVRFIDEHAVAAVGSDNSAVERMPFDRGAFIGVHVELLVKRGVTLMENLFLRELAASETTEFLFVVGALKVRGAAGSPINPVVIT